MIMTAITKTMIVMMIPCARAGGLSIIQHLHWRGIKSADKGRIDAGQFWGHDSHESIGLGDYLSAYVLG